MTNRENAAIVGGSRFSAGRFGVKQALVYEYKIYVHKKDYDNALKLLG